ncbi:MAG TPA: YeeE/YedE thiosulfate transporter family protein [Planctomycetota bacterium]|nr:YeeE/YedE thiosulfate transporter family protein [Planctomycetota bacterium]
MESLLEIARRPWPWWVAGPAIGLFVTAFAAATGNAVGVSGCYGSACARLIPSLSFFRKSSFGESWRLPFLLGMPLGGLAGALLAGPVGVVATMGLFDTVFTSRMDVKLAVLFAGGLLVGFGARWAGGCTSGHSIMGISQGQKASMLVTVGFMAAGMLVANFLFRVLGGR